jgi:hypothetical protein
VWGLCEGNLEGGLLYWELMKIYKRMLWKWNIFFLCRGFVKGTCRGVSLLGSERHVREGFGRGASLSLQRLREGNLEGGLPY